MEPINTNARIQITSSDTYVNLRPESLEISHSNKFECCIDQSLLMETSCRQEEEVEYAIPLSFISPSTQKSSKVKSLGVWYFNRKLKKRCYVSLTGQVFFGFNAFAKCREDKENSNHPSKSCRVELKYLISLTPQKEEEFQTLINSTSLPNAQSLSWWGIPQPVVSKYKQRGVCELFNWQVQCLLIDNGAPLRGCDLVYSAPTSGGKTLVSEILMLRRLALKPGLILFVVPFVSLVEEKTTYFQSMWKDMYIGVRSFHGDDLVRIGLTDDVDVGVCTIERANILLSQLLDEKKEHMLSMLVIDEIHMLSNKNRGFLLEVILSKIKYLCKSSVQVVGMSATLPNIQDFSKWLQASLFTTEYRPVNLNVYVVREKVMYKLSKLDSDPSPLPPWSNTSMDSASKLVPFRQLNSLISSHQDPDGLLSLVLETIVSRKSILVFCSSKGKCEKLSRKTTETINDACKTGSLDSHSLTTLQRYYFSSEILAKRKDIVAEMSRSLGSCQSLHTSILFGIAYHHAGLTIEERKIIEDGFRRGVISTLFTTSTLAAGVNLPAHRVVISEPRMGINDLSVSEFRQMCGRAGRMGLDTDGEAILMINSWQNRLGETLLTADVDLLKSSLHQGEGGGIEKLLLETICCDKLVDVGQIEEFIRCTLLYVQQDPAEVLNLSKEATLFLLRYGFIKQQVNNSGNYSLLPTPLGKATCLSGISPKDAVLVISYLEAAKSRLIMKSALHSIFLVTPPSTTIEPKWERYFDIVETFFKEHPDAKDVAEFLSVDMASLIQFKLFKPSARGQSMQEVERVAFYRRFYSSILLFCLIQEQPVSRTFDMIADGVSRGIISQFQKDAAAFCSMTVTFCKKLNWDLLGSYLEVYASRLEFGVRDELVELMKLAPEMTSIRAAEFFRRGIKSPVDVVQLGFNATYDALVASAPYESVDPLREKSSSEHSGTSTKESYERLATILLKRAKSLLSTELNRLHSK